MNNAQFVELLEGLSSADWQAVVDGKRILLEEDLRLVLGDADAINIIIKSPAEQEITAEELKRDALEQSEALLNKYYQGHLLTKTGFDAQVRVLIDTLGAAAFAAPFGSLPERTLFVDAGEVVAESAESPRHRYGAFYEFDESASGFSAIEERVDQWMNSGEAYQRFLNMNVCRNNC